MSTQELELFDVRDYPLVHVKVMPHNLERVERWIVEIEWLLSRLRAFVLIYPPVHMQPQDEDMKARKRLVLWLKAHRQRFSTFCRAMVLTSNEQPENLVELKQLAPILASVYGLEVLVEADALAAQNAARGLLNQSNGGVNW